jgi:hypothetical protein
MNTTRPTELPDFPFVNSRHNLFHGLTYVSAHADDRQLFSGERWRNEDASAPHPTRIASSVAAACVVSLRSGLLKIMTTSENRWGIKLSGHVFDLEDWRDTLKEPFDPWVLHEGDDFILCASEFQSYNSAEEVLNSAILLIDVLNGAIRVATRTHRTHPVSSRGVYQRFSDVWRPAQPLRPGPPTIRAKVYNDDGTTIPSSLPPGRSNVQVWAELSATLVHLGDALVYVGRGEWFDIYKAIECLEDWAGGQTILQSRQWVDADEFRIMKRTANSYRHRAGGKHPPPPKPISQERSIELLAKLIECSFAEAKARTRLLRVLQSRVQRSRGQ